MTSGLPGAAGEGRPVGFHRPMATKLRDLLASLQHELKPVEEHDRDHIAHISSMLEQEALPKDEWRSFVHFVDNRYTRHLVAHDENFTVLLLCWNKGQRSPIHDHSGSSCWVKVLEGAITETRFLQSNGAGGPLEEIGSATVGTGSVCYINDSMGLHEMANLSETECTVTLHVYSPPYYFCKAFALDGQSRNASMLAASAPPRDVVGLRCDHGEEAGENERATSIAAGSISLVDFADLLDSAEVDTATESIVQAFGKIAPRKAEWTTFAHFSEFRFQRLLIHQNAYYSLLMLCWLPGQKTPPHTHNGSASWVRVMTGELTFEEVDPAGGDPLRVVRLTRNSKVFAEDSTLPMHVVGNASKDFAISLHLYNPPYTELHYGNPQTPLALTPQQPVLERKKDEPKASSFGGAYANSLNSNDDHGSLPVVQCHRLGRSSTSPTPSEGSLMSEGGCADSVDSWGQPTSPLVRMTNLAGLVDRVERIFACEVTCGNREALSVAVMETLENIDFRKDDLERFWATMARHGGRIRLVENATFNITLNLWATGQRSLPHDYDGSVSWVKVIEGSVTDVSYEASGEGGALQVARNARMRSGDVAFYGPQTIHSIHTSGQPKRAATVHIYFGVCNSCRWFGLNGEPPVKLFSHTALADDWFADKSARTSGRATPVTPGVSTARDRTPKGF